MLLLLALALLICLPQRLAAQEPRISLQPALIRLGSDSMRMSSGRNGKDLRYSSVRSIRNGSGRDTGALVEVMQTEVRHTTGETVFTVIDTIVMGATDLRLRRARSLRLEHDGTVGSDMRLVAMAGALREITTAAGRTDTTRHPLAPTSGTPFGTAYIVMLAAPLSTSWRATYSVFGASAPMAPAIRTVQVDSVDIRSIRGRRAWFVDASVSPDLHWTVVIDSMTRDLIQFTIGRTAGTPDSSYLVTARARLYDDSGPATPRRAAARALPPLPTLDTAELSGVAGHYYLEGAREVGSELLLKPNGTFEFMLAYGALDESGAGQWRLDDGGVVLQSDGAPREPSVRLLTSSGVARDSLHILVVDTAGRPLSGITIDASRKKADKMTAQSSRAGYTLRFTPGMPPTEIGIGVDVGDFRVPFPLSGQVKAHYRFAFDRGDLGRRRFERERLTVDKNRVTLTLNGRAMTYVRH
jgi:hypothetical protein